MIHRKTHIISLVSFLSAFSSSIFMTSLVSMLSIFGLNLNTIITIRIFSEAIGYIGRFMMGFVSDWIGDRKTFLLVGYAPAIIIKPILFLCTFAFIPIFIKGYLISFANIIDKFLNSARDGVRDAVVLDGCAKEDISKNIIYRKSISYLGTIIGSIMTIIYLNYSSNYPILYAISMISGIGSVLVIIFMIHLPKNNLKQDTRELVSDLSLVIKKYKVSVLSIIMCSFGIFILFFGKISEMIFIKAAAPLGIAIQYTNSFYLIFYCCSCLMSAIIASYKSNNILQYLFISFILLVIANLFMLQYHSIISIIGSLCIYGMHNAVLESFIVSYISKVFHKLPVKGSILGLINIITGMSLLFNTKMINILLNINVMYIFIVSTAATFLSIIIFLAHEYINKQSCN